MNLALSKVDFLIPGIFAGIFTVLSGLLFLTARGKKISIKTFLLFSLSSLVLASIVALTCLVSVGSQVIMLLIQQVLFFLLGVLYVWLFYKFNKWAERDGFLHEFMYTLGLNILMFVALYIGFGYFNSNGYLPFVLSSTIMFSLPFLIDKTFTYSLVIPNLQYKEWYYPLGSEIEFPEEVDERMQVVIKIELHKNATSDEKICDNAFAPLRLDFGTFFTYFSFDHNEKYPGNKIAPRNEEGKPQAWLFYKKRKWWQAKHMIDPMLTINENGIVEHDTIIAERV